MHNGFDRFFLSCKDNSWNVIRAFRTSSVLLYPSLLLIITIAAPAHGQTLTCEVTSSTQYSNIRLCDPAPSLKSTSALIDFDSDGDLDIVTVGIVTEGEAISEFPYYPDPPPSPMKAYRNNGDFSFTDVTAAVLGDESIQIYTSGELEVADLTGDGLDDLFIADLGLDFALDGRQIGGQNRLLVQSVSGQLLDETTGRLPSVADATHSYDVGDVDGDSLPDIMPGNVSNDLVNETCTIGTFSKEDPCPDFNVNKGDGMYEADLNRLPYEATALGLGNITRISSRAPVLADIDNDADLDLILQWEDRPVALLNNGRGYFYYSPADMPPIAGPPISRYDPNGFTDSSFQYSPKFVAADLNLDGWVDILSGIVVTQDTVVEPFPAVQMFLNNGNGTFRDASSKWEDYLFPAGFSDGGVDQFSIADYNADGWPDIAVTAVEEDDDAEVVINRGQANFEKITTDLGVDPDVYHGLRAIFGDIDGDGDVDVLYDGDEFQLVENTRPFEPLQFSETDLLVTITLDSSGFESTAEVLYRVTVQNSGPGSAPNVNLAAGVPGNWTPKNVAIDQGTCSTGFNAVICQIGELAAGASAEASIALTLNRYPLNPERINFSATVTSDNKDSDVANNSSADAYALVFADDDNDHMPNGFEVLAGLDPKNSADAGSDFDNDGVNALDEFRLETDPNLNNQPPSQDWVLDNRAGGILSLVTNSKQPLDGPFTIDYWYRMPTSSTSRLFEKFIGTTTESSEINVMMDCFDAINPGPRMICMMRSLLGKDPDTSAGTLRDLTPHFDRWIHLAIVNDETSHRIYIDNELLLEAPIFATFSAGPSLLNISAQGYYAQIHLWNKALTPAEVNTARGELTGQEAGLVGYWPFDEGEGQTARDLGPHTNPFILGVDPGPDPEDPNWISQNEASSQVKNQAGISGAWYNPDLEGDGYNIIRFDKAGVVFFYGYSASGERVWLISEAFSEPISFGQALELQMFDAQGGTFDEPVDSATGLRDWGTLSLTFDNCEGGQFVLSGLDGDKSSSVVSLAGIEGVDCMATRFTTPVENPGGFAGLWFDPALDGEGYNIVRSGGVTFVFFYGYSSEGQRLWLISEAIAGELGFATSTNLTMFEAQGGTFDLPAPSSGALQEWGALSINFSDCGNGVFQLSGTDGNKTSNAVKLAGIEGLDCQN